MKKFLVLLMMFLMITSNCFAMTFSQTVEIGSLVFPPEKGVLVKGASYSTLNQFGKWQGESLYNNIGVLRWGNESNGIYYVFDKYPPHFGGKNKNFPVNVMVETYINQIKNDGNVIIYLIKNDGHASFARSYVLLGKRSDGEWVKYFDTNELVKKYFGANRMVLDNAYCQGNTIIIKCKDVKNAYIGEFRFKWDDKAQWFGVEHVGY